MAKLKPEAPLLLKIRNGDFDYPTLFNKVKELRESAETTYDEVYKNYIGTNERDRIESALEVSRMQRAKALKLELDAELMEYNTLNRLKHELKREFEMDLWDEAMDSDLEDPSVEGLYKWYKKRSGQGTTKSEMDIQLKRDNTIGLEYLL